jgi:hypothetical protein
MAILLIELFQWMVLLSMSHPGPGDANLLVTLQNLLVSVIAGSYPTIDVSAY